jgi:large subunit ribosomal protein L21
MYAIVKTGGKQYRVEEGQSLLVERLPIEDGSKATLQPLLYVDGSNVVDGDELAKVSVEARVVGHERGPKLRIVKFKPKRGYKRRTGHRQELTRLEVTSIKLGTRRSSSKRTPTPVAADAAEARAAAAGAQAPETTAKAERRAPQVTEAQAPEAGATAAAETAEAPDVTGAQAPETTAEKPAARRAKPAAPRTADGKRPARKPAARKAAAETDEAGADETASDTNPEEGNGA